jgi:pimeloyl-ACP methyl ester carboxylesterase
MDAGEKANEVRAALKTAAVFGGERRVLMLLRHENGERLFGTLHLPLLDTPPKRTFLLLPGWTGPRSGPADLLTRLAEALSEAGAVVLRLDFRSRGDSPGNAACCGLDEMIADANLAWRQLRCDFPGAAATVGGMCSGANAALGLAALQATENPDVAAFSALPFQSARNAEFAAHRRHRIIRDYLRKACSPKTWARLLRGEVNLRRVRKNLHAGDAECVSVNGASRNLKDSAQDIEAALTRWQGNALFVWGGGDEEATPARAHFEKLHAAGMGRAAKFETIEGANHNFQSRVWRKALVEKLLRTFGPFQ